MEKVAGPGPGDTALLAAAFLIVVVRVTPESIVFIGGAIDCQVHFETYPRCRARTATKNTYFRGWSFARANAAKAAHVDGEGPLVCTAEAAPINRRYCPVT
jgi:hypothetical protein